MQAPTFTDRLEGRHVHELHALYQNEWWTRGRTLDETRRVVEHSDLLFAFLGEPDRRLVAFARVLTDRVFKALVFDVIVAPDRRGEGLLRKLLDRIFSHPDLKGVKHLELYCLPELVPLYEKFGFSTDMGGVRWMRRTPR
jgi:predicted GNAT family N-acyltransferase